MACLLVPAAEAVVTSLATKKGKQLAESHLQEGKQASFWQDALGKLSWLSRLLWGGAFLLAFEHLWHGEIVPWFPFLTATESPEALSAMWEEMATAGVSMALLCTLVWFGMVLVSRKLEKKALRELLASVQEKRQQGEVSSLQGQGGLA